jgi:hypothetical protein
VGAKAGTFEPLPAFGNLHLFKLHEVKRQMRGRRIAISGGRLQTAQDDFLQPPGQTW